MALHLHFSDHLEGLVPRIAQRLRHAWSDPMVPPRVIVPSPSTGNWLRLRLTQELGAVANLPLLTLERFLWDILTPPAGHQLLSASAVAQVLLVLLRKHAQEQCSLFAPVRTYLQAQGSCDENKLQQLANRLATLLCEYEYNRPPVWNPDTKCWLANTGVDQAWLQGSSYFPKADPASEAWQSELYRELFAPGVGVFSKPDSQWRTLPQLLRNTLEQTPHWLPEDKTPTLMVQVSKISHFHRNTLLELSRHIELSVFLTNPCAEFWEDVEIVRHGKAKRSWLRSPLQNTPPLRPLQSHEYLQGSLEDIQDYLPAAQDDNRLLQLWGKTGKENVTLWCQAAEYDFEYLRTEDRPSGSVLAQVQDAVRARRPLANLHHHAEDHSLKCLGAPTRLREVEHLRGRLLHLLEQDPSLRLDEIAVYASDVSLYQSAWELVFGAYEPWDVANLSYSVLGRGSGNSLCAQGLRDLIALWKGDLSRGAVFRFLRNPIVLARLKLERTEEAKWEAWAASMGVFRGYDSEQRQAAGDGAIATDEQTFSWGLARLLLGNLACGPVDLGFRRGEHPLGVTAFQDFETSDRTLLLSFANTLERIAQQERALRSLSFADLKTQWAQLHSWIEAWLSPFTQRGSWDPDIEQRCWKSFCEQLDLIALQSSLAGRNDAMQRPELLVTLQGLIPQESAEAARGWNGTLTVAPLRSGHILPHRHLFVLGLDGDLFPGTRTPAPLDLIASQRILGDPDSVQDNRYAFLELLHAARESLTLSYLARDILKDKELLPSSLLLEFATALVEGGCPAKEGNWFRQEIPLLARKDPTGQAWSPYESALEFLDAALCQQGKRALHRLPFAPQNTPIAESDSCNHVSLNSLENFLKNPLEFHLKERLHWNSAEENDTLQVTDEPLGLNHLQRSQFFAPFLRWLLENPQVRHFDSHDITQELRKLGEQTSLWQERLRQQGKAPQAWFGIAQEQSLLQDMSKLMQAFALFCKERSLGPVEQTRYIANFNWTQNTLQGNRIQHSLPDGSPVELRGQIPHTLQDEQGKRLWIVVLGNILDNNNWKVDKLVRPLLQAIFARLGGWQGSIWILCLDTKSGQCREFPMEFSTDFLSPWLSDVLQAMLVDKEAEHLPISVVAKHWNILTQESQDEAIRKFCSEFEESIQPGNHWGAYRSYIEDWELSEPRNAFQDAPHILAQRVKQRFGWILAQAGTNHVEETQ